MLEESETSGASWVISAVKNQNLVQLQTKLTEPLTLTAQAQTVLTSVFTVPYLIFGIQSKIMKYLRKQKIIIIIIIHFLETKQVTNQAQ